MKNPSSFKVTVRHVPGRLYAPWTVMLLLLLVPPAIQAQFNYVTNNGTIAITKYTGAGGSVTIPSTISGLPVTSISDDAFYYCTSVTSLTIPNSVTSIGARAFENCSQLTSVIIPNTVTSIGEAAFVSCSSLASFTIPNGLTTIADSLFNGCTAWMSITIPGSVTNIGSGAFAACGMSSIAIPNSVTYIGAQAFQACRGLTSVTLGSGVTSIIGNLVFDYCDNLRTITVDALNPAYSSVDGVLFNKSQTRLVLCPPARTGSYTIPNSVTAIGDFAFYFCTSLTGVTIGNSVASIEDHAFYYCTGLTNLTIGSGVTNIGEAAFYGCRSLANVTIPNGRIGYQAFAGCYGLTNVVLGSGVASIGVGVFSFCSSLRAFTVSELNPFYSTLDGVLFNRSQAVLVGCPVGKAGAYAIPDSVSRIGNYAFEGCLNLTGITVPAGVISIGDYAFGRCCGLTSITVPAGVTSIGDYAFEATGLTSVTIPDSVTNLGNGLFEYCSSLSDVTLGNSVNFIGTNAFHNCIRLTSITIGNGVTGIADYAFWDCTGLRSVTIGNSVAWIGNDAFFNCSSLANITIPDSVTNIGYETLRGCISLTNVSIGNGLTHIPDYTFDTCSRLSTVVTGSSVTDIGAFLFHTCSNLTSVIIGSSVTNIGDYAFGGCVRLTSVTIPDSVTSIGLAAFGSCSSLTNVTIGSGVSNIEDLAFSGCGSLTSVYFLGNAPSIDVNASVFNRWLFMPYPPPGQWINCWDPATVYYLPGSTGWGATFGGRPTAPWWTPPVIEGSPLAQTAEAGSGVSFRVHARGPLLSYLWYCDGTNLILCSTNYTLQLSNIQPSQAGVYTAVITNSAGAGTSSPAMLQVIPPVSRRIVPGLQVLGQTGTMVTVDYADELSAPPNWIMLASINLTNPPQYLFDLAVPLPAQRFFRAWQNGMPPVVPSLDLHMVPAITLTGSIGSSVRVDAINQFGPIDAWVTLDTVTLTNTSQLYFDTSAVDQLPRLWRIVPVP